MARVYNGGGRALGLPQKTTGLPDTLTSLACRKAKELGYPHELWTTRLLARHAREHGPAQGHACLANLAQGTVCKILDQEEVKPHKVRYYVTIEYRWAESQYNRLPALAADLVGRCCASHSAVGAGLPQTKSAAVDRKLTFL